MALRLLFFLLTTLITEAGIADPYPGLQVSEKRDGSLYTFTASFDTPLSKCAAYNFLTDYAAARQLPGIIQSDPHRRSANEVLVERTAVGRILFFHVRLHSVLKYTEKPYEGTSFTQVSGDSRIYEGSWEILPNGQGSTLRFKGLWEPDTIIPDFIIDYFAKNELADKFSAVARLAEKRKNLLPSVCIDHRMQASILENDPAVSATQPGIR